MIPQTIARLAARTALCFLALPMALAQAGDDIIVVLNARNPTQTVSSAELKAIYLGQTAFWHGVVPMKVFTRPPESVAAERFLESVLDVTPQKLQRTWNAKELAGQGIAPTELASPDDVVLGVAGSPGAIGFITAEEAWEQAPEGVKYVHVE